MSVGVMLVDELDACMRWLEKGVGADGPNGWAAARLLEEVVSKINEDGELRDATLVEHLRWNFRWNVQLLGAGRQEERRDWGAPPTGSSFTRGEPQGGKTLLPPRRGWTRL